MAKLSDIQLVLLTSAAQRPDGSLLPPPASVSNQATRITKSIAALIKRTLVGEAEVTDTALVWRQEGEQAFGAFITAAGREAMGLEPQARDDGAPDGVSNSADASGDNDAPQGNGTKPERQTKSGEVLALLRRTEGATLDELVSATSWLPHTTRAALTGLRKKGHAIVTGKRGDITCYTLATDA